METAAFEQLMHNFTTSNQQLEQALSIIEEFGKSLKEWNMRSEQVTALLQDHTEDQNTQRTLEELVAATGEIKAACGTIKDREKQLVDGLQKIQKLLLLDIKESRANQTLILNKLDEMLPILNACQDQISAINLSDMEFLGDVEFGDAEIADLLNEEQ